MIILMMSLWLMFPFGACSTMDGSSGESSSAIRGKLLDDWDIQQCLSSIRPHENPEHYYRRGRYLQDRNKHRLAIQEFKSAVAVNQDYIEAYNALGISYDITGDYESAAKAYRGAILLDPDRDDILNNLGYSCLLDKKFDEAITCFEKAAALDGSNHRYHNNLGLAYAENGESDPALKAFRKTTDAADAHLRLAGILRQNGKNRAADEHLYLASALKDGRRETDRLLEQSVLPAPVAAIVVEDISNEAIQKEDIAVVEQAEEVKENETTEDAGEKITEPAAIIDAVSSSPGEMTDASSLPLSDIEPSNLAAIQEGIQEETLTASLETEEISDPAASESVQSEPKVEIDQSESEVIPSSVKDVEPAVAPEPEVSAEPADTPGSEIEIIEETIGEPEAKVIAPLAPVAPLAPAVISAPELKTEVQPVVAVLEPEAPAESVKDEIDTETITAAPADKSVESIDKGVAVEIVSIKGLESIIQKVETRLDNSIFRIIAGETFAEDNNDKFPKETIVYYCDGYLQEAWEVAKAIPGWQNMEKVPDMTPADIKIRAILWRDLASTVD